LTTVPSRKKWKKQQINTHASHILAKLGHAIAIGIGHAAGGNPLVAIIGVVGHLTASGGKGWLHVIEDSNGSCIGPLQLSGPS
jgi:hypothetical protein